MREADSLNAPGSVADYLENRVFIPINDSTGQAMALTEKEPLEGAGDPIFTDP